MTTYLSSHFTLEEMTDSQTAARQGIDNTPGPETVDTLRATAYALEAVRKELGEHPILISSGYRSPALNKAVGGSQGSQHLLGQAVDFTCPNFGTPRMIVKRLKESAIQYDQLILEFDRWVHVSFSARNRRHTLVIDHAGTREFV